MGHELGRGGCPEDHTATIAIEAIRLPGIRIIETALSDQEGQELGYIRARECRGRESEGEGIEGLRWDESPPLPIGFVLRPRGGIEVILDPPVGLGDIAEAVARLEETPPKSVQIVAPREEGSETDHSNGGCAHRL